MILPERALTRKPMPGLNRPHDVQDIRHYQKQNTLIDVLRRRGTTANLCIHYFRYVNFSYPSFPFFI